MKNSRREAFKRRFGSENITSDIMQAFQLSFNEAERIKTLHGGLVVTNLDDNELIELSNSLSKFL